MRTTQECTHPFDWNFRIFALISFHNLERARSWQTSHRTNSWKPRYNRKCPALSYLMRTRTETDSFWWRSSCACRWCLRRWIHLHHLMTRIGMAFRYRPCSIFYCDGCIRLQPRQLWTPPRRYWFRRWGSRRVTPRLRKLYLLHVLLEADHKPKTGGSYLELFCFMVAITQ